MAKYKLVSKPDMAEFTSAFATGISHVLRTYPKSTLDELTVQYDFDSSSSHAIDSWVALRKGVTRLELDLSPFGPYCIKDRQCGEQEKRVDPFSWLPDEIIAFHILSRLTLKQAVQSSVLSSRWKKLWIHSIGPKLIFSQSLEHYFNPRDVSKQKIAELTTLFRNGINHVLTIYPKSTLDELTIQYDFDSSNSHAIDSWVEYALRKGVTRLELDFSTLKFNYMKEKYIFPSIEKLSTLHALCHNELHQPIRCAGLYNLKDFCLKSVNVSSDTIKLLLSDCPNLERLCVWWTSQLRKRIKVSEKSVKLKSLEFVHCYGAKIEISTPNLVSLHFHGNAEALRIKHSPHLSELSIAEGYCKEFLRTGSQNFKHISELKTLSLSMSQVISGRTCYPVEFPTFSKLEQLEVVKMTAKSSSLLWAIALIKAAPSLQRFLVKFNSMESGPLPRVVLLRELCEAVKMVHHERLKLIEIHSFSGSKYEREFCKHLLGISQSLEQVVVAPTLPYGRKTVHYRDAFSLAVRLYRKRAQQLAGWLPPGAKLVVL